MTTLPTSASSTVRLTLWAKLVLFTGVIVVLTCSAQGWFFIKEQAAVVTNGLIDNGVVLARHLAAGNRYSILVGDSTRIREQIDGILTIPHVAYVVVRTSDGLVLGADGTGDWHRLFVDQHGADLLSPPSDPLPNSGEPVTRPVRFDQGVPHLVESAPSLLSNIPGLVLYHLGVEVGYFDVALPVLSLSTVYDDDPALSLTLKETPDVSAKEAGLPGTRLGTVQIGLSDAHALTVLRSLVVQVLMLTGLTIVLGTFGVIYLARRITAPIKSLTAAASRLEAGDFSVHSPPASSDEIGDLTRTFNNMAHSIEQHERDLRELNQTLETRIQGRTAELEEANRRLQELNHLNTALVSSASHELRTPITAMAVHLSNLLAGIAGTITPHQGESLQRIQENTERLRRMVDDLLDLSRLQGRRAPFSPTPVRLDRIIHDTLLVFLQDRTQKKLSLQVDVPQSLDSVWGDGDRLRQVFANLIHNAIKFSPPGGAIRVTAIGSCVGVTVCVADSGCGIPSEAMGRIFLPFYRCSNGPRARGAGLGLSIVKELVDLHGGSVRVESTVGTGTRFFVDLPVSAPSCTPADISLISRSA
ncbi:MAG: HAMP domain-containing histidine kinase [Nitrospira sp.]|nr:HAMP domain-containing histidine kinase [Nitrospira sp.]